MRVLAPKAEVKAKGSSQYDRQLVVNRLAHLKGRTDQPSRDERKVLRGIMAAKGWARR